MYITLGRQIPVAKPNKIEARHIRPGLENTRRHNEATCIITIQSSKVAGCSLLVWSPWLSTLLQDSQEAGRRSNPPDKITLCRNPPARTEPRGSYDLGEFCPGVGIGRSPERHADRRGIEGVSTANDNALWEQHGKLVNSAQKRYQS